jgi:integrase
MLPANVKSIARAVRAVPTGAPREYRIKGARGLVLHVLTSGTATWYFHYDYVQGHRRLRRKLKIARHDEISLADVIARAEVFRPAVRQGADPAAQRVEVRSSMTFSDLAEARLTAGPALRASSLKDYRDLLRRDILPAIGALPVGSVTRQHVIAILDVISARGSTRRADVARVIISSIFNFGLDRGLVEENPASGMKNRHDNKPRDVVLSAGQLRVFWRALENGKAIGSRAMTRILKLALLTGQRRAEIAAAKKADLDLDGVDPVLVIDRSRAKNHNQHRVPLSPPAVVEFRRAVADAGGGPYVFPNPWGTGHILPRSVSKAMERNREKLDLGTVRVHDLRRTVGSMMTRYGVPREIRERVLNHGGKRSANITEAVYSWYDHAAEKRAALELWADALRCLVSGQKSEIVSYTMRLARFKGERTVKVG